MSHIVCLFHPFLSDCMTLALVLIEFIIKDILNAVSWSQSVQHSAKALNHRGS